MKDIPAQLHNIRKTTMGEIIISFRVDELYTETVQELFLKKIGTEFVMKLEDVTSNTVLGGEPMNNDTRDKFFRQLHAKMREFEERSGTNEVEVKQKLIMALSKRNIDEVSTKDLDIKGLAIAISIVSEWLNE